MARAMMLIQQPQRNMVEMQDGATRKAVAAEDEEGDTLLILVEGEGEVPRNRAEVDPRIRPVVLPK